MFEGDTTDGNVPFISDRKIAYGWELNNIMRYIRATLLQGNRESYINLIAHFEATLSPYLKDDVVYQNNLQQYLQKKENDILSDKRNTKKQLEDPRNILEIRFELAQKKYTLLIDVMSRHGFLPYKYFEDEIDPKTTMEY